MPSKGGEPPQFDGHGMIVHDVVREEMQRIFNRGDYKINVESNDIDYLDAEAKGMFDEGLSYYQDLNLSNRSIIEDNGFVYILPWKGDRVVNTLTTILMMNGIDASNFAGVIEIAESSLEAVRDVLQKFIQNSDLTEAKLASFVSEKCIEKFDDLLPDALLDIGYGHKYFDIVNTKIWLEAKIKNYPIKSVS